ncbi:ribosome production factor 2 homolog [Notothenia coriiceps]|uniref:Ribosome production factor 2 homolog n=1 Tax=Notothenia coriiceps TaxID=8208 RepID=A0A6I9NKZ1_9TELE|nr:PREDICTED: ribosome production factor 2 homolog [Notothenia coriiceps]
MTQLDGVIKPKTKRSKRFLDRRAPKLTEDVKTTMIMKGGNASQTVTQALKDIVSNLMMKDMCFTQLHALFSVSISRLLYT